MLKFTKVILSFLTTFSFTFISQLTFADNVTTFITNTSAPYFFTNNSARGRANQIMQILSEKAGVNYAIKYMPLKRVVSIQAPYVIGDPQIFRDESKRAIFPIDVIHSSFFYYQHNDSSKLNFNDISSLKGKTIGVLRGSLEDKSFFEQNNIRVEESDSIESLFRKLISNRIDFCIVLKETGDYIIKTMFTEKEHLFKSKEVPGSYIPIAIMVDKQSTEGKEIARKYQNALLEVMNSQKVKQIITSYYSSKKASRKHINYLNLFIKQYQYTWSEQYGILDSINRDVKFMNIDSMDIIDVDF